MKLLIATGNLGKLAEFKKLLPENWEVSGTNDSRFQSIKPPEVPETGETYYEHALIKALRYQALYKVPVLADDSGLEVDALHGRPGVHSAFYGGEHLTFPERCQKLLKELAPIEPLRWTARFRCVLCFLDGHGVPVFFQGTVEGKIAPAAAGGNGFGYDPIFYSTELGLTFGEASPDDKGRISHRAEAVQSFLERWKLDHT